MLDEMRVSPPAFQIKAVDDDSGEFEGYASTFGGPPDTYGDIIAKGAFSKSLKSHAEKGSVPKLLWQHDRDQPIGKWLSLEEDEKGLRAHGRLTMAVPKAREAHALMKDGAIDGLSIGYRIAKNGYTVDDEGVWTLKEIDLLEVSVVTIGANERATVTSVKAFKARAELMDRLKAGDRLSEREFEVLFKGLGLSNSEAERAVRLHFKGQGEPADDAAKREAFLRAMVG